MPAGRLRFAVDSSHQVIAGPQARGDRDGARAGLDGLIAYAAEADRAGVDSFWLSEDPDGWDALAVLGAVACGTERIRLGTGVLNPYYRHPALIAASMATLDALSDGRAFLGFGRGQTEWYERALGMRVGSPLAAMEEAIDLLRQWLAPPWRAEAAPDATEFPVAGWQRVTGPVQAGLPIYLAAVGPKALALGARAADGIVFNDLASVTFMERAIAQAREDARAADRNPEALRFFARAAVTITDDPEAVWERRKATVAMIHVLPGMERLLETPGFDTDAIVADVREAMDTMAVLERGGNFPELRRAGDLAAARERIPTELMQELVVAGPVEAVRARLGLLREIGVTDVFLARPGAGQRLGEIVAALADA